MSSLSIQYLIEHKAGILSPKKKQQQRNTILYNVDKVDLAFTLPLAIPYNLINYIF